MYHATELRLYFRTNIMQFYRIHLVGLFSLGERLKEVVIIKFIAFFQFIQSGLYSSVQVVCPIYMVLAVGGSPVLAL